AQHLARLTASPSTTLFRSTRAVAFLAGHRHIGKELHLDHFHPCALTGFAASAFYVERKPSGFITPDLRLRQLREERPDIGEHPGIGSRIRPRSAPDGGLIDLNDFVDVLESAYRLVGKRFLFRLKEIAVQYRIQCFGDQGRFST